METKDIIASNELIALFMECEAYKGDKGTKFIMKHLPERSPTTMYPNEFAYNTSWDWLIPVVEKIGAIPDGEGYKFKRSLDGGLFIGIQRVYEYAVSFIQWYNANK